MFAEACRSLDVACRQFARKYARGGVGDAKGGECRRVLGRQSMSVPITSSSNSNIGARVSGDRLAHLPGDDGWPIVGNTFSALRDPVGHVALMHHKHGPVYRDHLFGVRTVALLGPEANELILFDREKNFS